MVYVTHDQAEALALGDRVAVLRAGALEQVGTPDDVYDRPATRFVAGFVGTPPMNFIEGEEGATVGVRPEDLVPDPDGSIAAVVEVVERGGHDRVWHVRAGDRRLRVRPPADAAAAPGDSVRLAIARATRFDADGRAL